MKKSNLENRIKALELELSNLKSGKIAAPLQKEISFRQAIEKSIPSGIAVVDNEGKQVYVNQAFCNIVGWDETELLDKHSPYMYWSQNDLENINNAFQQTLNNKAPKEGFDLVFCNKTGKLIPVNVIISPFLQEDNKLFFLANVIDITERKQAEDSLKKSQLLLSSTMDSQKDTIIFSIDNNYNYLTFNEAHWDSMKVGYNKDVKTGMNILDCITSDTDRLVAKENFDRALKGESFSTEQVFGDVNPLYFENFHNPIRDNNNEIIGCTGLARNITERRQAENALHNNLDFSETLLKTIPFAMDIVDETGTVIFQNEQFKNIFGESAIGKKCWDLYKDDKKQCSDCPLLKGINIGKTETYKSDGVLGNRIFDISHTGMMYDGKKAMLEIFQDITENVQSRQALIHSHDLMQYIIEHNKSAIAVHDRDLNYIYVSKRYLDDYKIKEQNIIGKHHYEVLPDLPQKWRDVHQKALAGEVSSADRDSYTREDGTLEWTRWECRPWYEADSLIGGIIVYTEVITERRQAELELIAAKEKAEESDRLKSAFLTNMSHEIRTPMNGILGFSNLLKTPNLTGEEQQNYIQIIEKSGQRMLNTINDIVNISKIESGLVKVDIQETNINAQMEFTYEFFKPEVESKGIQFFLKNGLSGKEANIKTDNKKVDGILTNLVKNAVKFTHKGSIELGYVKKGEFLEFHVKDTGIGIPKDRLDAIFERFIQADIEDKQAFQGSGLGLSISKSFVEMLGGKIWLESEEGLGSIFYFTIPYNIDSEDKIVINNALPADDNEVKTKNLKILIVEDDEVSHSLLSLNVNKISSEVLHAKTGVEAVEFCKKNPDIDLVLMDGKMPKMDGYEATRQIRQFNKELVIIAQTAYGFESDCKKALEAGCNDYISKPIKMTLLMELIKKHVNKK